MNQPNNDIVKATLDQEQQISHFLRDNHFIYRHLDWLDTIDWLGKQPYLLAMSEGDIQAIICAASEIELASWIRFFGVRNDLQLAKYWEPLLENSMKQLKKKNFQRLMALATQPWFAKLLTASGFVNLQNIIILEWKSEPHRTAQFTEDIIIRSMQLEDLEETRTLDKDAFPHEWQISLNELHKALNQKGLNTVAVRNGNVVGYLISTNTPYDAHLARLAVSPQFQREGVASHLVSDFLAQVTKNHINQVTVNTQADNTPSINLYQKFGFQRTSQVIPVWELIMDDHHKNALKDKH